MTQTNNQLRSGENLFGFTIKETRELTSMRSTAYLAKHHKSGAEVLHIHNQDTENMLAIAFRTPPIDDTGLPHILEHTVLCGSQKFPVKDPFIELLQCSLATFLNAMTYPDKTVYPCASMVEKDFFNLAEVYCDAVFFPLLTEEHFKQEGHHFDFATPGDINSELIVKGIVYNEMKGAYSDLDGTIDRFTTRSICPDNAYGLDSGGDPDKIPELKYADFKEFHRRYYHPANSRIFIYGNIPTHKHLEFLERACLNQFELLEIDSNIKSQSRWEKPSRQTIAYSTAKSDNLEKKHAVAITFLCNQATDSIRTLGMHLLETILLDNAASPLRKALIDSRLGDDLIHSGYDAYQLDTCFSIGLKGMFAKDAEKLFALVISTCKDLASSGIEEAAITRALHQFQFATREITSQYPLVLMDRVYRNWIYDCDPCVNLLLEAQLDELTRLCQNNNRYLETLLQEYIVDNPHYTILTFKPDPELAANKQASFAEEMKKLKNEFKQKNLENIACEAQALDKMQSSPNTPEALATLPRLGKSDIPEKSIEPETSIEKIAKVTLLKTDVFANGINYLYLAFDINGIEDELIDYLPLYAETLHKMGAGGYDYLQTAEREAASTGGIAADLSISSHIDDANQSVFNFMVSLKFLDDKLPQAFEVLRDKIIHCDFHDKNRMQDVITQAQVSWRSRLIPAGSHFASLQACSHLSANALLAARVSGVAQIHQYDYLTKNFSTNYTKLVEKMQRIQKFILAKNCLTLSFVGAKNNLPPLRQGLQNLIENMSERNPQNPQLSAPEPSRCPEGLSTATDVAFAVKAFCTVAAAHHDAPVLLLLSTNLSFSYLWQEVRVKGGAYGASASYNSLQGIFTFSSYRDPCLAETLTAFDGAWDYIENEMDLSPEAVNQAVIGTVKVLDKPVRPGASARTSLGRYLCGSTPEFRKNFRKRLLQITPDDIRRVSQEILRPQFNQVAISTLASPEKFKQINEDNSTLNFAIVEV